LRRGNFYGCVHALKVKRYGPFGKAIPSPLPMC
jgi:hypothetical protein